MREFCKACNVNYQAKIGHDSGCPYCTLERLEAENARLREALTEIASGKLIDCVGAAKKALEAGDE